jgi:uncharacterized repeat protein (TIGR01451 family)
MLLVVVALSIHPGLSSAATLTWNGGVAGDWANGGAGWLNGGSPATWNNTTPDAAIFSGTASLSPTINAGGITVGDVSFTGGNYSFSGGTLTMSSGNIAVGSGLTATYSQTLGGSAGLTKTGAGTLSLSGNNKNYTGTTTINGGVILLTDTAAGSLGSSSTGNVNLDGGALHGNFSVNKTPSYTFTIGASGGEFRTLGVGRWLMTGNKINGSGTLTLTLASASRFQPANSQSGFSGKWVYDGGGDQNRIIDFNGGSGSGYLGTGTGDDVLTIVNSPSLLLRSGVILGTPSQGVTLGSGEVKITAAGGAVAALAGKISGPSGNAVQFYTDNASSVLVVSNTANSWLGNTSIQGLGTVRLGASGVFPDAGGTVDVLSSGVALDLNGYSETVGGLSGFGRVNNAAASTSVMLGVGGNNLDSTFSGTITNTGAGASLQVVKVGAGTWTFSGTGFGYAGGTVISNGAIQITAVGNGRIGPLSTSPVTLSGGRLQALFGGNTTVNNAITVATAGGELRNLGNDSQRWTMGNDSISGSGTLILSYGTQNTRFGLASSQSGFTGKWVLDSNSNANRLVDVADGGGFGNATGDDAITMINNGSMLLRNGVTLGSGTQGLTLGSGGGYLRAGGSSVVTIVGKLSGASGNNVQFYTDGSDSVHVLANIANSWLGDSLINGFGTLRLGASGVFPDAGGTVSVSGSTTLDMNGFNETIGALSGTRPVDNQAAATAATLTVGGNGLNATYTGSLTDTGAGSTLGFTKTGIGTQTLSSANSHSGLTTVQNGSLRVNHASAFGDTAAGTVVQGGSLEVYGSIYVNGEPLTLAGTGMNGNGALRNLVNNNTWEAAITLDTTAPLTIQADSGDLKLRGSITQTGLIPPTFQGNGNIFIETSMNGGLVRGSGSGDVLISGGFTVTGDVTVAVGAVGAFKVDGALVGNLTLNGGQFTGANGSVDDVTLNNGLLSPGANGVTILNMDNLILNSGAYQWNITNATGTAGVNWDLLRVGGGSGTINLSGAGIGAITVRVSSALATLPNFFHSAAGSWMIAEGGSVSGFAANKFVVDDSGFTPSSEGGIWTVSTSGGDLYLNYAPGAPIDLTIRMTDNPEPAPVGDTITYTMVISNKSASVANEYYVTNHLGAGLVYSGSSDGGTESAGVVRWTLLNLAANGTRTISVTAISSDQGTKETIARVLPRRAEADASDNSVTNTTSVFCPTAGVALNNAPVSRTGTNGAALSFTVVSSNADCNPPFLRASGLPSGATFTVVTSSFTVTGTFTWNAPVSGTHPVRFFSFNETKATSTVVTLLYVNNGAEGNNGQGIPNSQVDWHVGIDAVSLGSSGNVTLVWDAIAGITYDVYRTTGNFGDGSVVWTKVNGGLLATTGNGTQLVSASGSQVYLQVVPEGVAVKTNGVWAVMRPSLPPGFSTMAAPVDGSDLSFAGEFGAILADALVGHNVQGQGDEVFILNPNGSYSNLYLDASGTWRAAISGTPVATHVLNPGQGIIVLNRQVSNAQPEFSGPVGNTAANTITVPAGGYTILGLSEGRHLTLAQAFSDIVSGTGPIGSFDESSADMIIVLESDGSYTPLQRLPNGTWLDQSTFSTSALRFTPGKAYWYYRTPAGGAMTVRF